MTVAVVSPGLFLGDERASRLGASYDLVVNCTTDLPFAPDVPPSAQVRIAVKDNGDPRQQAIMRDALPHALRRVRAALLGGGAVLVHCRMGQQRSAAVAAACALLGGAADDVDGAVDLVRARKPDAFFGAVNFREALDAWWWETRTT